MNRYCAFVSVFLLWGISLQPANAADESKKDADLRWAKGVAKDFLEAAFNGNIEQAENLIDSSLKKSFAGAGDGRLREWLSNSIGNQGFRAPAFQSEEIAT